MVEKLFSFLRLLVFGAPYPKIEDVLVDIKSAVFSYEGSKRIDPNDVGYKDEMERFVFRDSESGLTGKYSKSFQEGVTIEVVSFGYSFQTKYLLSSFHDGKLKYICNERNPKIRMTGSNTAKIDELLLVVQKAAAGIF